MDANEPVVVHTTNNLSEAEILKNVLEGEGIECELDGENQGGFVGVLDVRILVRLGRGASPASARVACAPPRIASRKASRGLTDWDRVSGGLDRHHLHLDLRHHMVRLQ